MTEALARAVSFDFGQTLAELDTDMLSRRLRERAIVVPASCLDRELRAAWSAYDRAILGGQGGHPWKVLMHALLTGSGVPEAQIVDAVDWLWSEQPTQNLWRRPIAPMLALARELVAQGVPLAVLSNSEGKLDELIDEMGLSQLFVTIADSGRLGMEKPDREIFEWVAVRLGVPLAEIVHIGDSRAADVDGALAAGMRAVWYTPTGDCADDSPRVRACRNADEVGDTLQQWGCLARSIRGT